MHQNSGRTFGPFFNLFLVNLLSRLISAKYAYLPFHLPNDPSPWFAYNKPLPSYHHHYYSQWHPIKNPYYPSYQNYPTLTTPSPNRPVEYNDYHQDYDYTTDANYDALVPAESINVPQESTDSVRNTTVSTEAPATTTVAETTTEVTTEEPIAAESNVRRHQNQKNRRRVPSRRDKYPQKRRRTTTAAPEYYDSYEDITERFPNRKRRPAFQHSAESYYDGNDDEYYDYETTTRYYKKQKRRPTRKPNRNQNQNQNRDDDSVEVITTPTLSVNPNTEIVIVRQAQTTSGTTTTAASTSTTTSTSGTTTTEPTTIITNTTVSSTTSRYNGTYGYGPSNGNEYVSFTYAPPVAKPQYQVPYFDWYTHEAARNAIVKRVHDIVDTDRLNFK